MSDRVTATYDGPGHALLSTPIGPIGVFASDRGLAWVWFDGPVPEKHREAVGADAKVHLDHAVAELTAYFAGELTDFTVPLDLGRASDFARAALARVAAVPYGTTKSYGAIARELGRPDCVRAVGRANATNPIPLVIPCHRIVGSNGSLTGYGGGIERKDWLLAHEAGW
jgi:methylated-DNA-[protein]-cysteine S-methyltransferase